MKSKRPACLPIAALSVEIVLRRLAQAGVDERDVDAGEVARRLVTAGHRDDGVRDAVHGADVLRDPLRDQGGLLGARAFGRADAHLELRLIVLGEEAARDALRDGDARRHGEGARHDDHPAVTEREAEHLHVDALDRPVEHVDDLREASRRGVLDAQRAGAEHRREREAHDERNADGECHRVAEVLEEAARDAADEGDRDEDRHE